MTAAAAHELCGRCAEELGGLCAVAFRAIAGDDTMSQDTITDAMLTELFPREGMLRRVVATLGLVKTGVLNIAACDDGFGNAAYTTTIRFIHQSFYEYFAAVHLTDTILEQPLKMNTTITSEETHSEAVRMVRDIGARCYRVRLLAAGLTALPERLPRADAFWRAALGDSVRSYECAGDGVTRLGVHETHRQLVRGHKGVCDDLVV